MDTEQIQKFMRKINPKIQNNVFAANRLPQNVSLPIFFISNLDPDFKPGSHWVAVFINSRGVGEYFDSFGRKPTKYHEMFLKRNTKQFFYNGKIIQNYLTSVCGIYCLVYIYFRSKGISMHDFVNMFSTDTLFNDFVVKEIFFNIFSD